MEIDPLSLDLGLTQKEKENFKPKGSSKLYYEAQSQVIRGQIGELENIRNTLGLSARKMCQLLMVDPSAWTRWTKRGDPVPPHIYRTLQFYMIIQEKIPGLTPYYFIGRAGQTENKSDIKRELQQHSTQIEKKIENIHSNFSNINKKFFYFALFSLLLNGLFAFALFK